MTKGVYDDKMKNRRLVACEYLTAGFCPLNCAYCYIPKSSMMKDMHEEIREQILSGEYIDRIYKLYGEDLEYIGYWGTEPYLTLNDLSVNLKEFVDRFPKLKEIGFSTSMMLSPEILIDYVKALVECEREIKLRVQISLDGPDWISDVNRVGGAVKTIISNIKKTVEILNDMDLEPIIVEFRWKPTHDINNIKSFVEDKTLVSKYFDFFRDVTKRFESWIKNDRIKLLTGYGPTLAVPGKYTSSDGKIFAEYLKAIHEEGYSTTYSGRLKRIIDYEGDLHKRSQFSCSGGDSNLGFDNMVHICHRTFYYNNKEYIESILEQSEIENWDISLFKKGTIEHINKYFIVDPNDEYELNRFLYVMRGYHDFWKFQMGYVNAMLVELARSGQADEIYLHNSELRELLALFVNISLSCPMENLLNTGSIHLQVVSLLRLFSNGAFQEIVKNVKENLDDE